MPSLCNITVQLRTEVGDPEAWQVLEFVPLTVAELQVSAQGISTNLIRRLVTNRQGEGEISLLQGVWYNAYLPHIGRSPSRLYVPEGLANALLEDLLFPRPLSLEWEVRDSEGDTVAPGTVLVAGEYLVALCVELTNTVELRLPSPNITVDVGSTVQYPDFVRWTLTEDDVASHAGATWGSLEGLLQEGESVWKRLGLQDNPFYAAPKDYQVPDPDNLYFPFA